MKAARFLRRVRAAGPLNVTVLASSKPPKKPKRPIKLVAPSWRLDGAALEVTVPLRLKSLNVEENGFARARRRTTERTAVTTLLNRAWAAFKGWVPTKTPHVTLTRLGPRFLDGDNNMGAGKSVRDATATWLGFADDSHASLSFEYVQEKSDAYGVRIRIEAKEVAA